MSSQVVIALGGNVGDVSKTLLKACGIIEAEIGDIILQSGLYQTKAWGKENQADFINQVIVVKTVLSPQKVLALCLNIEASLGRERKEKWGERAIDIDIIFYDDKIINSSALVVPHPLMHKRNFVLIPLNEILPGFVHPVMGKTVGQIKNLCKDKLEVVKIS